MGSNGGSAYPFGAHSPLSVAAKWVMAERERGVSCPCCGQLSKVYRRQINSIMARAAIVLYRCGALPDTDFQHLPTLLDGTGSVARGGDPAKLVHWHVIEQAPDGEKRSGYYRLTERGLAWIHGKALVARYAYFYDGKCLRLSDELVSVFDALGDHFSYAELMKQ